MREATPLATAHALCEVIPDRFEYRAGATYVGSTVTDLLDGGAGVCQDFVHLGVTLLRELAVGARYVSGYLFAASEERRRRLDRGADARVARGAAARHGREAALDRLRSHQPRARRRGAT